MTHHGFDGVGAFVTMPASGETVNSTPFDVPKGAKSLTINCPGLTGAAATLKIQALAYPVSDQATEVWRDVSTFNLADGSVTALDGIPEGAATVLPVAAIGGGPLRFVASEDQSGAPVTIPLFFSSH